MKHAVARMALLQAKKNFQSDGNNSYYHAGFKSYKSYLSGDESGIESSASYVMPYGTPSSPS